MLVCEEIQNAPAPSLALSTQCSLADRSGIPGISGPDRMLQEAQDSGGVSVLVILFELHLHLALLT